MKCTKQTRVSFFPVSSFFLPYLFNCLPLLTLRVYAFFITFFLLAIYLRCLQSCRCRRRMSMRKSPWELIKAVVLLSTTISFGTYRFTIALIANGTGSAFQEKTPFFYTMYNIYVYLWYIKFSLCATAAGVTTLVAFLLAALQIS